MSGTPETKQQKQKSPKAAPVFSVSTVAKIFQETADYLCILKNIFRKMTFSTEGTDMGYRFDAERQTPPEPSMPLPVRIWHGVRNPLKFLSGLEADFGDIVTLRKQRTYAIFRPEYIKHILQDNHPNYGKGERYRSALARLMGNGLVTSDGAFWLRQRRLAQHAFQRAQLASLARPTIECVSDVVNSWLKKASQGKSIALREDMTALTLRIALRNLFSVDTVGRPDLIDAVHGVNEQIRLGSAFLPFHVSKWVPTPSQRRFTRSLETIDTFAYKVIADRRAAQDSRGQSSRRERTTESYRNMADVSERNRKSRFLPERRPAVGGEQHDHRPDGEGDVEVEAAAVDRVERGEHPEEGQPVHPPGEHGDRPQCGQRRRRQ